MAVLKVWNRTRKVKKFVSYDGEPLHDFLEKASHKLGQSPLMAKLVTECDGTEIDDEETLSLLINTMQTDTFILLARGEEWSSAATSANTVEDAPEPPLASSLVTPRHLPDEACQEHKIVETLCTSLRCPLLVSNSNNNNKEQTICLRDNCYVLSLAQDTEVQPTHDFSGALISLFYFSFLLHKKYSTSHAPFLTFFQRSIIGVQSADDVVQAKVFKLTNRLGL